jgi:hypothetical protein
METVKQRLVSLEFGALATHEGLAMVPLLGLSMEPDYLLLEEALDTGCAQVSEVSAAGDVNQLRFSNKCQRPVLLLDGEEIRGAKQNRVMNLTILVPAQTELIIPVSCVEAGRWRHDGDEFAPSRQMHFSEGRAAKMRRISESLKFSRLREADQGEIWRDIERKMDRLKLNSPSQAMADAFDQSEEALDAYVQNLPAQENQVGSVFAINGKASGIECFDSSATYSKVHPKIVRSFALDALEKKRPDAQPFAEERARSFLVDVSMASMEDFDALGKGRDVRVTAKDINGGALVDADRVVHLCVFRTEEGSDGQKKTSTRLIRRSTRGRRG